MGFSSDYIKAIPRERINFLAAYFYSIVDPSINVAITTVRIKDIGSFDLDRQGYFDRQTYMLTSV